MEILLTDDEVRVLGCLMEKEMATPDYYPLSLNALKNACNQKSNRKPVVSYDDETVVYALNGLQEQKLIRQSNVSRVPKYEQIFSKDLHLITREEAILCILLVRGPQTVGEIRSRTERLYSFGNLDEVKEAMSSLEDIELMSKLPRQPGRKECRFAHRLSGEVQEIADETVLRSEAATVIVRKNPERDAERDAECNTECNTEQIGQPEQGQLQEQIDTLRKELQGLQAEFVSFKEQFE